MIKSKNFKNLTELNDFVESTKSIKIITINGLYEDREISYNCYYNAHVGYELIYFDYSSKN